MNTIAELRKQNHRTRLCPLCHEHTTEMVLEVKIREREASGRTGTTAARSRTLCEPCAVTLYEAFTEDMNREGEGPT